MSTFEGCETTHKFKGGAKLQSNSKGCKTKPKFKGRETTLYSIKGVKLQLNPKGEKLHLTLEGCETKAKSKECFNYEKHSRNVQLQNKSKVCE
jgi:hypothetical protein